VQNAVAQSAGETFPSGLSRLWVVIGERCERVRPLVETIMERARGHKADALHMYQHCFIPEDTPCSEVLTAEALCYSIEFDGVWCSLLLPLDK
jgi:hypothetical protein